MGCIEWDNCGDTYDASTLSAYGWSGSINAIIAGRVGSGGAIQLEGTTPISHDSVSKIGIPLGTEFTWHHGFSFDGLPGSDTIFLQFMEGSTVHVDVRLTASGTIRVTRNGTSLGLGTAVLSPDTFYQLVIHVKIHDSTGEVHLWVEGVSDISATGLDTMNGGTGICNSYSIHGRFGWTTRHDDIHIWSGNDNKGISWVEGALPDADGAHDDWTTSSGTDHFPLVDDAAPDESSYVYSDTAGLRDSYEFPDVATVPTSTVLAVGLTVVSKKLDIGARSLAPSVRVDGADFDAADASPSLSLGRVMGVWDENPDTTAPWTVSEVNAAEGGFVDAT